MNKADHASLRTRRIAARKEICPSRFKGMTNANVWIVFRARIHVRAGRD